MKHLFIRAVAALLCICSSVACAQIVNPAISNSGTGAVARTYLDKARESIEVRDYAGATAGAKLAAAIAAAPSGAVIYAEGLTGTQSALSTITIGKPIWLIWGNSKLVCATSPCVVINAGGAGTVIEGKGTVSEWNAAATSNFNVVSLSGTSGVTIRGMHISGNAVGTDPVLPVRGLLIEQSTDCDITGNVFSALNYGVHLSDTTINASNNRRNRIHHNTFLSAYGTGNGGYGVLNVRSLETQIDHNLLSPGPFGRHGIYISAGSRTVKIDHNTITGAVLAGLSGNSGTGAGDALVDIIWDANIVTGSGTSTAYGYGMNVTGGISNSQIVNNVIRNAANDGIYIQAASASIYPSGLVIANNEVSGSQGSGLGLYDIQKSLISANRLSDNGINGAQAEIDVGKINVNPVGNVLSNNKIDSAMLYGVRLDSNAAGNTVRGTQGSAAHTLILDNGANLRD